MHPVRVVRLVRPPFACATERYFLGLFVLSPITNLFVATGLPDLSPQDLEFLADHPEVWVHTEHYTLERQQQIIEGRRQLLAIQKGTERCPATGRVCGRLGHDPHGIHSGCVLLNDN